MEIKDNVISLFDEVIKRQRIKEHAIEQTREALFMQQHSDDDVFENNNEFEFKCSDD